MNLIESFRGIFSLPALSVSGWGLAMTFFACIFIVLTKRWHGYLSMDESEGIQKFHTEPTPRVGGISIVLGVLVASGMADAEAQKILLPILLAGMPAFLFGLAEDLTKRVSVMKRLLATFASGVLAWWLTDYSLGRVDVWGLDALLQFTVVSIIFTAFAVGGVSNAINIIDGFNGLASMTSSLAFVGYALIAYQVGDHTLASVSMVLSACVLGFFWVNWPLGKIFLGDGGSYFVGFALAWVAVMLLDRNESVSSFAVLLVCVHPVIEAVFSIFRRKIKKAHPGHPDRLHFHSLVKKRYVRRWFPSLSTGWRNSITGLLVGGMTLTAVLIGGLSYDSGGLSILAFAAFGLGYIAIYARMVRHHWCSPIEFLMVTPERKLARVRLRT